MGRGVPSYTCLLVAVRLLCTQFQEEIMFARKLYWIAAALVVVAVFAMAQQAQPPAEKSEKVIKHVTVKASNARFWPGDV